MTTVEKLQVLYNTITLTPDRVDLEGNKLIVMAVATAFPGYIGGYVVKWFLPSFLPAGCALATMPMMPIACGCGFIAAKVAGFIHKPLAHNAAVAGFLVGGCAWVVFGSLAFSANPALAGNILLLTFVVALTADLMFAKRPKTS